MAVKKTRQWSTGDTCKYDGCVKVLRYTTDPKMDGYVVGEGKIGMCSVHHRKYAKANGIKVRIDIDWSKTHKCVTCGKELCRRTTKPEDLQGRVRLGRVKDSGYECSVCHAKEVRWSTGSKPMRTPEVSDDLTKQRCNECKEWYDVDSGMFRPSKYGKLKLRTICRPCDRSKANKLKNENPELTALKQIYYRYRIDYDEMLSSQNGECAICKIKVEDNSRPRFDVDHDHSCCPASGQSCGNCVRGLLCRNCNLMLGMYEDDCDKISKQFGGSIWGASAIAYLKNDMVY